MKLGVDTFEVVPGDVRIDLGRGNISMAEKFLDNAQIGPTLQHMRCKGMAERVRRQGLLDPGLLGIFSDHLPDELPRQSSPPFTNKEVVGRGLLLRAGFGQIGPASLNRLTPDGNNPLLAPFSVAADEAALEVHIAELQADDFGDSHPGGVETFQERLVPNPKLCLRIRRLEDRIHFARCHEFRQALPELGTFQDTRDIFRNESFTDKKTVKKLDRHQAPGNRGCLLPAFLLPNHKIQNVFSFDFRPVGKFSIFFKGLVRLQVHPVGLKRVRRQPLLDGNVI